MKKIAVFFSFIVVFIACEQPTNCCVNFEPVKVTLQFNHHWDGVPISASDFNQFKYTNLNGELIQIEKLRYLVSNIRVGSQEKNYQLINIGENSGFQISFYDISQGSTFVKFTFGFADADNVDGVYQDLNSVSFNVPAMLGGGYHFMQFDGKFKDVNNQDANFNYHVIRAVNNSNPNNLEFFDTSFEVELGTFNIENNTTIEIDVNIAEWFKNPYTWNLNQLNTVLMPNFEAQKQMSANGKSVFSLGTVTQ